jgi:hypothetical protein
MAVSKKTPPKPQKVVTPKKPKDALDLAVDLISPSIEFARANFRDLFTKFLKVGLVSVAVYIGLALILGLITFTPIYLAAGSFEQIIPFLTSNLLVVGILVIWLLFSGFIINWITSSISTTALIIAKEEFERKYSGIWPMFHRIKMPVLGYMLLNLAIMVIFIVLPLLLLFLLRDSQELLILGILLMIIYFFIFMILYRFLAQFWIWELIIAEHGVLESLKKSLSLVSKNIVGVFVFDILVFVAALVISIPFIIIMLIVEAIFRVGLFALISTGGIITIVVIIGIYVMVRGLGALIQSALTETFVLPYTYSFWKRIREKASI